MKNYNKNLFLKVMWLVLVLFLTLPSQIFASAITTRDDKAYDGNKSIMGLAGLSMTSDDDLTDKPIENNQVLASDKSTRETDDFLIEKSASISKTTGLITYKIAVTNKGKTSHNNQNLVFATNSNLSDLKVDKVTAISDDGLEREISYQEKKPSILNRDKDIETFGISTESNEDTTIYYICAKLSDDSLRSLENIENSNEIFSIDYAILDGDQALYQERYSLHINEQYSKDHFALLEDEDSTNNINATYIPESSNIFGHSPATISYTDFILAKDDQEFIYKLQLDENQSTENSQINIDFYQAKEEGYVINKTFSQNIPFTKELKLQIPSGQFAKINFTSTVKENANPQNFTFNNKAIANPDYEPTSSKEEESTEEEDSLPDNSFDKEAGANSSNDSIAQDKDQDFSANPNTEKAETSTDNSFNNKPRANLSNDSITQDKDQDFSSNSNTKKEDPTIGESSNNESGSNSSNDIITDDSDLDFSANSKSEDKVSAIAINKDGYLAKFNNESRLTNDLEGAINDITSDLEAYNNDEIYLDELQASIGKIAGKYNLDSSQIEEIINALISGLNEEKHKVAKLNASDIIHAIASNDGQRKVEKALAGPDANIPADYLDRLVSEKLQEEGITIEGFQNYMYELEEKYGLSNEDVDRVYTENEEAIKKLISKAQEEKTTGDVFVASDEFANKQFRLLTQMDVLAVPNWQIPANWYFDVNIGPYLYPASNELKPLTDANGKIVARAKYIEAENKIRYTFPEAVKVSKNLDIDQMLAFNTSKIGDASQIDINISVKPKNMLRKSMPTMTVRADADSPVVTAFPGGKVPVKTPTEQQGLTRTYPYNVDYWTYQYYDASKNTVNWDIRVETDQVNLDHLDYQNLGVSLYAPENQKLSNYKVTVRDYLGNDISTNANASKVREGVSSETGTTINTGTLKASPTKNLLTYNFDIPKSSLPKDLIIHVEATPTDAARFTFYDLGLRLTPDNNYINTIVQQFKDDWAKLVAAMPWIIPYKSGDAVAAKFEKGFNVVDTRLPAYTYGINNDKYSTRVYADKSRSIYGQFTNNEEKIKWQVSETLRLQDDDRLVSKGSLGSDVLNANFINSKQTKLSAYIEVLEPNNDGSFTRKYETTTNSDSSFRDGLSKVTSTLKPGTVINYIFTNTVDDPNSESSIKINFNERLDYAGGSYGGEQTASISKLSIEEKNDRFHIGMEFRPVRTGKTWRYSQNEGDYAYRVYENYDMVFCINPGVPSPVSDKFWKDDAYQIHKETATLENLKKRLPQSSSGTYYTRFTPEVIEDRLKKTFYYAEQLREEKNLDDFQYYEMVKYVVNYFTYSKQAWDLYGSPSSGKYIAPSSNATELLNRVNSAQGWNQEKADSVLIEAYWNTKEKAKNGDIGVPGDSYAHGDQWQNMITGKVIKPFKFNKIKEDGQALKDAKFVIRDENGVVIKEFTSNGAEQELYLKPGKYTVEEVSSPSGYKLLEKFSFEIKTGIEKIEKKDIPLLKNYVVGAVNDIGYNYKQPIPQEETVRYLYDTTTVYRDLGRKFIESKESKKKFEGGNYVQEYYEVEFDENHNNVDSNGNKLVSFNNDKLSIEAKNIKGAKLEVSKKLLAADGEYHNLPGIKFTLKEDKLLGEKKEVTTNKDGIAVFDNLPLNSKWTLTETIPNGIFNHNATWKVSVDATGKVTITENGDTSGLGKESTIDKDKGTITIYNKTEQNSSFKIKKVDQDRKPLGNVGFTLYQQDKKTPIRSKDSSNTEYFTNADGYLYFSNLPDGIYYLKETTVPDGYAVLNDGWTGLKIESGNVTIIEPEDETASENATQKDYSKVEISNTKPNGANTWIEYDIVNHLDNVDVSFTKYGITKDSNGKEYTQILPGAVFKLQILKDNKFVDTGKTATSDSSGQVVFKGLSSGEYQIIETETASDAYRKPDGAVKTFKVEAGKVYIKTANGYEEYEDNKNDYIYNEQKGLGKLLVHKVDDNGKNLAGVEFTLYKFDPTNPENALDIVNSAITDSDGYAVWEDLPYGKYWIKETKARPGYILDNEKKLVNITKDYSVPDQTNPRDVSNSISIDRYNSYVYSTEGNLYQVYPNYGQGLVANLTLNINPQTKVIPGDQFTLRLSDNLDLDGVGNVSDGSDGKYDIIGSDGTIAKASIGNDRKTITYTFTNAIRNRSVSSLRLIAPMYPNRLLVQNDTTPRFNVSIGQSSFAKNDMTVYYSHYQKDNTKPYLNAYTYKLDPINNKFTVIAYVNSNRVYSANKQYLFEANAPVSITSFKTYRSSNNNYLPASYGIDFDNPGQYGLSYLGNKYNYNSANQFWVNLEANNNYTYVIKIEGTLKSPTPTAFETQSYLTHTFNDGSWVTYTANTWSRFYDPCACGDTSTDNPEPSEQMLKFVNKENAIEFTKVDGSEDPLKGAKFKLVKDGKDYGEIQTSDAQGKFGWKKLEKGSYQVIETDAPRGYTKPQDPVSSFEVNENGEIINIKDNTTTIKNYKASLPITGGPGSFIGFALLGTAVMLTALAYFGFYQMKSTPLKRKSMYR